MSTWVDNLFHAVSMQVNFTMKILLIFGLFWSFFAVSFYVSYINNNFFMFREQGFPQVHNQASRIFKACSNFQAPVFFFLTRPKMT